MVIVILLLGLGGQQVSGLANSSAPVPSNLTRNVRLTETAYCKKVVPGLDRISQGVDISQLDLFPPDITAPTGFVQPIVEFTCAVEHPWYNPKDTSEVYDIPDQVEAVIDKPAGSLIIHTRHDETMEQCKKSMAAKVGLELDTGLYGSFSSSASYKDTKKQMLKTDKSVSEVGELDNNNGLKFWVII